jgi:chromosome partitioning protein
MATKIAIATHKGGSGKTVTTLALATGLARNGRRCLLIDLDPQGHCSPGVGLEVVPPTLKEFFERHPSLPLKDVLRPTYLEHLNVLPSDLGLAWVAEGLSGRPKREELLARSLRALDSEYEWILMDTPPNLGVLTQNAVSAADFVLIPTSPDARAVNAISDLLDLVRVMKGDSWNRWRILLTRVDSRKSKTNTVLREALEPWNGNLFRTVIPQSEPLNQAQMASKDVFSFDPASSGAIAYQELINELLTTL